jgi:hypothetical protein
MPFEQLLGGALSLFGAKKSSDAAEEATAAQVALGNRQIDLSRNIYRQTKADLKPWVKSGRVAQQVLNYEMGLGKAPMIGANPLDIKTVQRPRLGDQEGTRNAYIVDGKRFWNQDKAQQYARQNGDPGKRYQGFEASRDFKTGFRGGIDAIDASAAASGMGLSGRTIKAANKFGTDYTMGYRNNYLNSLGQIAASGQNAAAQKGNAGANFGAQAGNALGSIGNAQAAGAIGQANAWNNALGDVYGLWNYQKSLANGGV